MTRTTEKGRKKGWATIRSFVDRRNRKVVDQAEVQTKTGASAKRQANRKGGR